MLRKNTAGQFVYFTGVNATTGAALSGASWTGRKCLDGTFTALTATVTEDGTTGFYKAALAQGDTNANDLGYQWTATNAVPICINVITTAADPTDAVHFGLSALPNTACTTNASLLTSGSGTDQLLVASGKVVTPDTQKVDVNTIKTNPVVNGGTVTFPTTATLASTTNITAGTIATVTNQLTAAQIATGVWQDATGTDFQTTSSIGKSLYTAGVVPGGTNGLFIAGTNAQTTVTSGFGSNSITATSIATDAIGSSELAASAISEIAIASGAYLLMGTIDSLGSQTIIHCIDLTFGVNDLCSGQVIALYDTSLGGPGFSAPSIRRIVSSTATDQSNDATITIDSAPEFTMVAGDTFRVCAVNDKTGYRLSATGVDDIWDELQAGHTTPSTFGKYLDSAVSGVSSGGLSAADIATAVWKDATAGDFGDAGSIGNALYVNAAPGAANGHFVAGSNAATTVNITGTITTATNVTNGVNVTKILGTSLTEGDVGVFAGTFSYFFGQYNGAVNVDIRDIANTYTKVDTEVADVRTRVLLALPAVGPGLDGGVFIAGTNAPTTITTGLTTTFTGNLSGTVGSLSTQAKADVNAEVVDALSTDTYAEPGKGAPAATTSLAAKISYLFKALRNKKDQSADTYKLYGDDGTTVHQQATVSDDGSVTTIEEMVSGP